MASSVESSQYLASKASALASTSPVPPSQAQAAQIPLQSFELPNFPPEAFTAGLASLILTSDIKLDEYSELLTKAFAIPELPPSIKNLTLELFALGYPPGFLTTLGKRLPDLKALTLYSQLLAGTTVASREDALTFLRFQTDIQELHLLDVFGSAGFFTDLSKALSPSLKFLEVNYTYRHSDPQFLATIPSADIPSLISKELVALTMGISSPDVTDDADDREGTEVGVKPISGKDARIAAEKLLEGEGLVMCDITMFELDRWEVETILDGLGKLKVFSCTVRLEKGWEEVFEIFGREERGIEVLEVVGVPGEEMVERLKGEVESVTKEMIDGLCLKCVGLKTVKISILRTRVEQWVKEGTLWEKKI
ncbi:hypothetical protein D0Z07_0480 [Hyphodiscus hymeniophilus]|uniref:Uncharacterized protein n=1 Tax=Hyphodiscus hymeniophilus TaxID=353542 RepID=A0A9P6VS62_9HELO|nr:hypothetical protein D0Z07_0480 [Hyphodiscus hymeniophilus]